MKKLSTIKFSTIKSSFNKQYVVHLSKREELTLGVSYRLKYYPYAHLYKTEMLEYGQPTLFNTNRFDPYNQSYFQLRPKKEYLINYLRMSGV